MESACHGHPQAPKAPRRSSSAAITANAGIYALALFCGISGNCDVALVGKDVIHILRNVG